MATRTGTAGKDVLIGTDAIDFISGLAGDDQLTGNKGADVIDGGDGIDTARYDTAASAVIVDLQNFRGMLGDALGDQLFNIENVVGSQFADVIDGDGKDNVLAGLGGADILRGGGGSDTVDYGASKAGVKASLLTGIGFGGGDAVGDRFTSIENLTGSAFADELEGDGFANVLSGGAGADTLFGGGGKDTLKGGDGSDRIFGDAGADVIDGGSGSDTLDYGASTVRVQVDLATGKGLFGDAEGDTISGVETVIGSDFGNALMGDDFNNALFGGAGIDFISGRGGNDVIAGGAGADFMDGGDGFDKLDYRSSSTGVRIDLASRTAFGGDAEGDRFQGFENVLGSRGDDTLLGDGAANTLNGGDAGDDTLFGRGGDDVLQGGLGADRMDGGSGNDTVEYRNFGQTGAVQASLDSGVAVGGTGTGDIFIDIENLVGTVVFGDSLFGNGVANRLEGLGGNDLLDGKGDNDVLIGGAGADVLTGGAGADTFRYELSSDSVNGARDRITDFVHNVDEIDLSGVDAKAGTSGNQVFSFIGTKAFTGEGQIRFFVEGDHTVVQFNTAGSLAAESEIELAGHVTLTAGDFIL